MLRRFLLVGLMVVVHDGEMLQLIIGTVITAILLSLTDLARPYKQLSDNYVSSISVLPRGAACRARTL